MGDGVFGFLRHLGKAQSVVLRDKDGVIAKSVFADGLVGNASQHRATKAVTVLLAATFVMAVRKMHIKCQRVRL